MNRPWAGQFEPTGDTLENLLSHSYYRTRIHAAEAIRKVGGIKLIPAVRKGLETEPVLDVRLEMAKTIKALEPSP